MVLISGIVRFIQELRAKHITDYLSEIVESDEVVFRNGKWVNIPSDELVVGDQVRLFAGDRIPADIRLTAATDLFVSQSVITGESADVILLKKDLMVLEKGIIEGRKTYANMIKYIKMTASSNFGNMFSVLAASALLPILPMMSVHLIFLNLIYDLSCTAIPWDNVDEEFLHVPRKWDASSVGNFMI